jgi:hypothetical protein
MSDFLNLFHADSFQLNFSNIPSVSDQKDIMLFEKFVKGVNLPEYGLQYDKTVFQGHAIITPQAGENNIERSLLLINFKLSEHAKNYLYLYSSIQNLRYGSNIQGLARKYVVSQLDVMLLDNIKRRFGWFQFTNALCVGISALPLEYGTAEEIIFTTSWEYENALFQYENPSPEPSN